MSWTRDGTLDWRRDDADGARRLEFRDRTRALLGGGAGGLLVAVLTWALLARIDGGEAETPSLMMHGVLTAILAVFALSAAVSRTRFAVRDGQLLVQDAPALPIDEIDALEVIQRGAYAGLAARRSDGSLLALAPVFLSRAKAERVGQRLGHLLAEIRAEERA